MGKPAAILDVGSSKLVCLVGSLEKDGGLTVHGVAAVPYCGYTEDGFEDADELREKVTEVIRRAEQESCIRIREAAVSVPGAFSKLAVTESQRDIPRKENRLTDADIAELVVEAEKDAGVTDAVLMHSTPISYLIDGVPVAEDPAGRKCRTVFATVSHMYVKQTFCETIETAFSAAEVEVSMYVSQPLASALSIIPEAERVRPAVLIDAGYSATEVAIIENGGLTGLTSLSVGGKQFVSDLSFGLDIPQKNAEIIKRRYVFGQDPLSPIEIVRLPEGPKRVQHKVIRLIMDARMGELTNLIREALESMGGAGEYPVVYLSGGGITMMKGASEYLRRVLNLQVRKDIPYLPEMDTPNYTSAFGTLDFVLRTMNRLYPEPEENINNKVNRIREFFKNKGD